MPVAHCDGPFFDYAPEKYSLLCKTCLFTEKAGEGHSDLSSFLYYPPESCRCRGKYMPQFLF